MKTILVILCVLPLFGFTQLKYTVSGDEIYLTYTPSNPVKSELQVSYDTLMWETIRTYCGAIHSAQVKSDAYWIRIKEIYGNGDFKATAAIYINRPKHFLERQISLK